MISLFIMLELTDGEEIKFQLDLDFILAANPSDSKHAFIDSTDRNVCPHRSQGLVHWRPWIPESALRQSL